MTAGCGDLGRRLERAGRPDPMPHGGRTVELVVGIDFGTTCTKVVGRLPYEAGAPAFAVPAPSAARAEAHPYLTRSAVFLGADGMFGLVGRRDATPFAGFKASLVNAIPIPEPDAPTIPTPSAEELTAAFVTLQLRSAVGWLLLEHGDGALGKGRLTWSWNFGFPAASLDDGALASRYRRCAAAALALARSGEPVSLDLVRATLASFAGERAAAALGEQRAHLVPEVAASVAGFAHSARLEDELYALVDVGGLTVDACTFNLLKVPTDDRRCANFEARVEQFGVEPWRACSAEPKDSARFRKGLDDMLHSIIWDTKTKRAPRSRRWRDGLPLFQTGGGIASAMHKEHLRSLDHWLRKHSMGAGVVFGSRRYHLRQASAQYFAGLPTFIAYPSPSV